MSRSHRAPSYAGCGSGRKCTYCGPKTASEYRDARHTPAPDPELPPGACWCCVDGGDIDHMPRWMIENEEAWLREAEDADLDDPTYCPRIV
jgi:hypothetical protein